MSSINVQVNNSENNYGTEHDSDNKHDSLANPEVLQKVLERFYKCRDFELSHVWLRSVFLGAFLILLLSGYGYFFVNTEFMNYKLNCFSYLLKDIVGFLIAFAGIYFSIIWIYMGKASKKWYEVYERVISDLEKNESLQIPEKYRMGEYHYHPFCNDVMTSTDAGNYSPSRLNIMIGYLIRILD